jgi:hypothetical protein
MKDDNRDDSRDAVATGAVEDEALESDRKTESPHPGGG